MTARLGLAEALHAAIQEAREPSQRIRPERLARAWEGAGEPFLALDGEGRVIGWNRPAEALFGWAAPEVLGRSLADVLPSPGSVGTTSGPGAGRLLGRPVRVEALRRDGRSFDAQVTAWPVGASSLGQIGVLVHVGEGDGGASHLEHLAGIVDCSEDAIVGLGLDATVVSWNRGAELMYGHGSDEMVGRSLYEVVPPERRDELAGALAAAAQGEAARREMVHVIRTGETVEVALTISPVRDRQGRLSGASAVVRDVTEQRWLARTLDSMMEALAGALGEAQEAEARSRRFLADAAHQLRRPVAGLQTAAQALVLQGLSPTQERLAAGLVSEASRASRLINDLLQVARLDQGSRIEPQPCDVVALCQEEAERIRRLVPEIGVTVTPELAQPQVLVDGHAIREALANLFDNARRHAHSRIDVTVGEADGTLEIAVADDGPGLPADKVERAFDRFASLDGLGGSGLGLPIARGLARAHGGDLTYEGGRFVIRLPPAPAGAAGHHRPRYRGRTNRGGSL